MANNLIKNIQSRYIIDSRGNPTVEVDIYLKNGILGRAAVPSGASTGDKEALELRDKSEHWNGKGVDQAIKNIEKYIKPALLNQSCLDISRIDNIMLELDGTMNKSKLGANAILAVSLATVQAAANFQKLPLFEFLRNYVQMQYPDIIKSDNYIMPMPMMNILNGGSHADNNVDIQEFMIMPTNFSNYTDALKAGVEIFHSLKSILKKHGYNTSIGDEGGFAPMLRSNNEAIELILEAIQKANYIVGHNIELALDVAASEFYNTKKQIYYLESNNSELNTNQLIDYYQSLCSQYPIISIEDGLDQNDWESWTKLNSLLGQKTQIVGDDLTVTNTALLKKAINKKAINAILIKLNQIGTFTETMEAIQLAKNNDLGVIISHRSGETENTFIADLAVAVEAGQIKTGSLCRTDRVAKYNQLLRIIDFADNKLQYASKDMMGKLQ